MDKALNYMALARKGGRIELGEEPVGAAARAQKARLVLVASDASDHTWRRAKSFVAGTQQQCLLLPLSRPWASRKSMPVSWKIWKSGPSGSASTSWRKKLISAIRRWAVPGMAARRRKIDLEVRI